MIEVTYRQLVDTFGRLMQLGEMNRLPQGVAMRLARNIRKIRKTLDEDFFPERDKIAREHKAVENPQNGQLVVPDETEMAFRKALDPILDEKVSVDIRTIKLSEIPDNPDQAPISPNIYAALDFMFEDDKYFKNGE